jgi:hypothetical protein
MRRAVVATAAYRLVAAAAKQKIAADRGDLQSCVCHRGFPACHGARNLRLRHSAADSANLAWL